MIQFTHQVKDPMGIHARPASLLTSKAMQFESDITVSLSGRSADCKNVIAVMSILAREGDLLEIEINGPDEKEALVTLKEVLANNI